MASQIFRYRVTGNVDAQALSWKSFRAVEFLHNVTRPFSGKPGYIARTAVKCGEAHQVGVSTCLLFSAYLLSFRGARFTGSIWRSLWKGVSLPSRCQHFVPWLLAAPRFLHWMRVSRVDKLKCLLRGDRSTRKLLLVV